MDQHGRDHWEGNYWGPNGTIIEAYKMFDASEKTISDHVKLASTLYSAAGAAAKLAISAVFRLRLISACDWLDEFSALREDALKYLNLAWEGVEAVVTAENLNDVEPSIAIWLKFGWSKKTKKYISRWLPPAFEVSRRGQGVAAHTRAFLLSHAIDARLKRRDSRSCSLLEKYAADTESAGELNQATRVWRHAARQWAKLQPLQWRLMGIRHERTVRALERARICAEKAGAKDQLLKIG